jgi:lysozyme family protein
MTEKELFEKALAIVLEFEGYKTEDTGGRTVYGISENAHPEAVEKMWNMPAEQAREEAKKIYYEEYWKKVILEESILAFTGGPACAICLFDTAVNLGVKRANGFYENAYAEYGINYKSIMDSILLGRIEHYVTLAQKGKYSPYLKGWLNRVIKLRRKLWFINQEQRSQQ